MVIVVEESAALRGAMAATLRQDGHEVIELTDGAQLLARLMCLVALLGQRRDSIAVVTTLQASVAAVLRMLRAARWRTPVVLVTAEPARAPERDIGAFATLGMPVDMEALRAAVADAIGSGGAGWASRAG